MFDNYEAKLADVREEFGRRPSVRAFFFGEQEALEMEAFLISFNALGVGMTEPVEDWIRRAGQRCGGLGLTALGEALIAHARHEAGHHLLMLNDLRHLVTCWNDRRPRQLQAEPLLALGPQPGVAAYRALHEDVIAGPAPYGQLAIEYEIEMLSVRYGPRLIESCTRLLGPKVLEGLSFVVDHVEVDAGHTNFNRLQLRRLLEARPEFLPALAEAGAGALRSYGAFLDDCQRVARTVVLG